MCPFSKKQLNGLKPVIALINRNEDVRNHLNIVIAQGELADTAHLECADRC